MICRWSPVDCPVSELPSNFTPGMQVPFGRSCNVTDIELFSGLMPVLRKVLISAHEQGFTRRAVLCAEGVCHIRSSRGFDNGKFNNSAEHIEHPVDFRLCWPSST